MLDLGLLAKGRVDRRIPDDIEPTESMPLVQLARQENYAEPEKATQMTIQVYKAIASEKPKLPRYD